MSNNYKKEYREKKAIKYIKDNYDQFSLRVPKGDREKYKKLAESQGKSLNGLINELLDAETLRMAKEEQKERVLLYSNRLNIDTGLSEKVLDSICCQARNNKISKLILFGSRARGDYDRASDIDLAAYGEEISKFRMDLEELVPTLLTFDVVDLKSNPSQSIMDTIFKEGTVIYEEV